MTINSVSSVTSTAAAAPTKATGQAEELGQDTFLTLLLAQLQNQDPLKPMDDTEFIAQLAQFNSLNQLTAMNETLSQLVTAQTLSQGSAMIGKTVTGISGSSGTITGVVTGLHISGDKVTLDVGGELLPMESVKSIEQTPDYEAG